MAEEHKSVALSAKLSEITKLLRLLGCFPVPLCFRDRFQELTNYFSHSRTVVLTTIYRMHSGLFNPLGLVLCTFVHVSFAWLLVQTKTNLNFLTIQRNFMDLNWWQMLLMASLRVFSWLRAFGRFKNYKILFKFGNLDIKRTQNQQQSH